ncbi:helix-turn-helix domain-containing protein [Magnetococcus sp. PR-3]|uniref:helix-turn-helix domain-containing protein n=1 Tax=Magnetococcus sp. PR-3 TaxID=3120355 RepID=UPI002FCDF817
MEKLEKSFFTTQNLPVEQRFSAWQESIGVMLDSRVDTTSAATNFQASVESYLVDNIVLSRCKAGCQKFDRLPIRIAQDGIDHYMIQIFTRGRVEMNVGQKEIIAPTRTVVGFDLSEVLDSVNTDFDLLSVIIPRERLAPLLRHPDTIQGTVVDSTIAEGKLFADFLEALFIAAPTLSQAVGTHTANSLVHLAAAAMNGAMDVVDNNPQAITQHRLLQARNYIEQNLCSEKLTPQAIALGLGLSRASLYRLFEPLGGVAAYIRNRRIKRAFRLLVSPPNPDAVQRITDVAFAVGFNDVAQFSRLFKDQYGITPSEARKQGTKSLQERRTMPHFENIGDHLYELWIGDII